MSQTGPWSVKGIDQRARDAAREAAQAEGITLGEYLNRLLMSVEAPRPNEVAYPFENRRPAPNAANDTLDKLTRRIEATEARSTLAITGMDHTILGLVARLEEAEHSSSAVSTRVDGLIEELRETHSALQAKVQKLENDDTSRENLEALKSLEQALGKLASHVFEENELAQNEAQAVKGRVETGFADLNDRMEGMEVKVERTLSDAASRVEKAVNEAELRAESTARDLADQLSNLETHTNLKLARVDKTEEKLEAVEARMTQSLESMESVLSKTQDRLNRAEATTDAALMSLEATFNNLDTKIETLSQSVDASLADRLRAEFESRFEEILQTVRTTVDSTRQDLAAEIARTASGADDAALDAVKADLADVRHSLAEDQNRQAQERETVSSEIERIGGLVGDRLEEFGEQLDKRVNASEQRTAEAISQIGDQVATVATRLQARQDKALETLAGEIAETRKRADASLNEALTGVTERLDSIQTQTHASLSPIQKAMASLATRLETLEDTIRPQDSFGLDLETPEDAVSVDESDGLLEEYNEDMEASELLTDEFDAEFEPGLPQQDDQEDDTFSLLIDETEMDVDTSEPEVPVPAQSGAYTEDYEISEEEYELDSDLDDAEDDFYDAFSDTPEPQIAADIDPFADLSEYDDSHTEARESDIFEEDEFDLGLAPAEAETEEDLHVFEDTITEDIEAVEPEPEPNYIDMARKAAIAASSGRTSHAAVQSGETARAGKSEFSAKLPLYAAASAVVITGATIGGYLYLRGKQAPAPMASAEGPHETGAQDKPGAEPAETADMTAPILTEGEPAEAGFADISAEETIAPAAIETGQAPASAAAASIDTPSAYAPVPPVQALETAAASGNGVAQYQLAQKHLTEGKLQEGAALMRRAADQGLPIAQYTLSKLHERGTGIPKDLTLARQWTEKAALGGNVKAMHDLAVFMAEGEGGDQSYAGAVEWFRKGAEYGIVDSQYNLGVLYEQGLGISPNLTEALYWFMIAARNGDAGAPEKVMDLTDRVSPEAAALAKSQANSWNPSRANGAANGWFGLQAWELGNPKQVMATQLALQTLGFDIGTADGAIGKKTAEAIRAYQAAESLPVTGTITPDLIASLNARAAE